MQDHPPDETLAAYVDGALSTQARQTFEAHLTTCDDCHAVWQGVAEFRALEMAAPRPVVKGRFGRSGWVAAAMAAAVVMAFLAPQVRERMPWSQPREMRELAKYANNASARPFASRISADFAYKAPAVSNRGVSDEEIAQQLIESAAANVIENQRISPREKAIAHLYRREAAEAAKTLEEVLLAETLSTSVAEGITKSSDAALLNDLAAAYYQSGQYESALKASERAVQLDPAPRYRFNRALAIQQMTTEDDTKAIEAWEEYIRLEPDPQWKAEAQKKLNSLRP